MTTRRHRSKRSIRRATRLFGALSIAAATLVAPNAAGAEAACGQFGVEFDGVRLLNDGANNTAGPFSIDLPAGTYDVTIVSYDDHTGQPDIGTQPNEQFVVELNNGYVSPASIDIPDGINSATITHGGQSIGAATSLTLRHVGVGGINSVDPQCVGFTPVDSGASDAGPVDDSSSDPADSSSDADDAAGDAAADASTVCTEAPSSSSSSGSSGSTDDGAGTDGAAVCDDADGTDAAGDDAVVCDSSGAADADAAGDDAAADAADAVVCDDADGTDAAGDDAAVCDSADDAAAAGAAGDDAAADAADAVVCDLSLIHI